MVITLRDGETLPADTTFLVRIGDDSLEPRFRRGAMLYVDRRQPPQAGDAVLLIIKGGWSVAVLLARSPATVRIEKGGRTIELPAAAASALYRIVPTAELLLA